MGEENESEPTFRKPDKQKQQDADPHADQRAYFAYWEAKRIEDERKRRTGSRSLNVYERARQNGNR